MVPIGVQLLMIRVLGDSFCDIMASDMTSLPKVGGDVLANIAMCAGGSGLNSTVHGAHFADVKGLDVRFQLLTALGNDFQVILLSHHFGQLLI